MILGEQTKNLSQPVIYWPTSEIPNLPLIQRSFPEAEVSENLFPDLFPLTMLALAPAHLHYSQDQDECVTDMTSTINFEGEQYALVSSLPFNQENLPASNVVDRNNCDGGETAHLQCQGDDVGISVTANDQTDDEVLFLEPEFIELEQVTLNYSDSYHPLNCQCLKLKLDSSLVIYISPAKKIALLLNK